MRRKYIVFILAGLFLFSCQSAPVDESAENPAGTEGISSNQQTSEQQTSEQQTSEQQTSEQQTSEQQTSEQQTSEQQTSEQQTSEQQTSEQQTSEQQMTAESGKEMETALPPEEPIPSSEETTKAITPVPEKTISKLGGMKKRESEPSETIRPEKMTPEPSAETLPEEIAVPEDLPETPEMKDPEKTGIAILENSAPETATDVKKPVEAEGITTEVPEDSSLPADIEENSFNPLLPVVIIPDRETIPLDTKKTESSSPANQPQSSIPPDSRQKTPLEPEEEPKAESPPETPATPSVETTPLSEDQYTLASDATGKLSIYLDGAGWIYLSSSAGQGVVLRDKSYDPGSGRTRFVFSGADLKQDFEMIFLKQDLLRGESEQKSLVLDSSNNPLVMDEKPPSTAVPEPDSGNQNPGTEITNPPERKTAEIPDNTATGTDSPAEDLSSPLVPATDASFPPVGLSAAELLSQARSFENPGPGQSLEKAIFLYEKIRTDFPVTEERFIAEERIRYLNKHYFKVQ